MVMEVLNLHSPIQMRLESLLRMLNRDFCFLIAALQSTHYGLFLLLIKKLNNVCYISITIEVLMMLDKLVKFCAKTC